MTEDSGVLGQQGTQPNRPVRYGESHHLLTRHRHGQLAEKGSLPVVAIRQHQDLPVVADLEQLLGASMHSAYDDPGRGDHVVLGPQP